MVLQCSVRLENWPEDIWHRQNDAHERNIQQGKPLLPLPQQGAAIAAAWAALRFAGVIEDLSSAPDECTSPPNPGFDTLKFSGSSQDPPSVPSL
jgi:hypothetical protein